MFVETEIAHVLGYEQVRPLIVRMDLQVLCKYIFRTLHMRTDRAHEKLHTHVGAPTLKATSIQEPLTMSSLSRLATSNF